MKVKESISLLITDTGKLVTVDEKEAKVLNNFFVSVFTGKLSSHTSGTDGLHGRTGEAKSLPL